MIDKIVLIHIKDRKILMAKSCGKDVFYTPGGKREGNETDHKVLMRETKEELSANLLSETINYYGTFADQAHGKPSGVIVKMTCYAAELRGKAIPGGEVCELKWCAYADRDIIGQCDQRIFDDLKKKDLID